jgi:hypothetical protein
MFRLTTIFLLVFFIATTSSAQQTDRNAAKIEALEDQKQQAVANKDYALAGKLKKQIDELKNPSASESLNTSKIAALEKQKQQAVVNKDYALAGKLKKQIDELKNPSASESLNTSKIAALEKQKQQAVANKNYSLAGKLKKQIDELKNPSASALQNASKIATLEKQKSEAVANKDYGLAKNLKKQIDILKNPALAVKVLPKKGSNIRETERLNMTKQDFATTNNSLVVSAQTYSKKEKLKYSADNAVAKNLKYRRNSVYTLMISDPSIPHAAVIKDAFGNSILPSKFNDHNIGPYAINTNSKLKDHSSYINTYLTQNNIAKQLVAKWFNRGSNGAFNMDLIAARGEYDATAIDKVIAGSLERGDALLADAGEELIGKTFIIVHNFRYTNKEEVGKGVKKGLGVLKFAANMAGAGQLVDAGISTAQGATTVAGKGYFVRSHSYLYRLVWTEETEAIFYQNHWVDNSNLDQEKIKAFSTATNYKLQYVGTQTAGADVQSSVFTNKSEADLIRMATTKASDRAVAKLERQFEEFRTKTPLYSGSPITAKIGLKEGLEKGDKFEVLDQILNIETGKMTYKRVGVITVDGENVWDNSLTPEEEADRKKQGKASKTPYTYFKGSGNYYPGQLIKQIN